MTGGGNGLKNQRKSSCYLPKIYKNLKCFTKKLSTFLTPCREEELSRGVVLIEFAMCMPVLIILLFYINDLMRIKRLYSQTEFVGQQMANILQNIAKTKQIGLNDIKRAASLAYLTIYPGTTMYTTVAGSDNHILNHQPRVIVYYVKGESDGTASVVGGSYFRPAKATAPTSWTRSGLNSSSNYGQVRRGTNVPPSSIYPTLKVEKGCSKVLLETQILCWGGNNTRKIFGCYLVNPRGVTSEAYFSSVVIFTPNSGFTENVLDALS